MPMTWFSTAQESSHIIERMKISNSWILCTLPLLLRMCIKITKKHVSAYQTKSRKWWLFLASPFNKLKAVWRHWSNNDVVEFEAVLNWKINVAFRYKFREHVHPWTNTPALPVLFFQSFAKEWEQGHNLIKRWNLACNARLQNQKNQHNSVAI